MAWAWFEDARKRYKISRELPQVWSFPTQRFAYIQIPKVASRSIRQELSSNLALRQADESFKAFEDRCSSHIPLPLSRRQSAELTVFAFVRHPLGRLHSAYLDKIVGHERSGKRNILRCHGIEFGISFGEFVERVCQLPDDKLDRHLRSQSWFLRDKSGLVPEFIGRLERFEQDWTVLRKRVPCLGEVSERSQAGSVDYQEVYGEAAYRLACERFSEDFELFGYT
ncbi:sulfotransferase family 2 domain-containing protein [Pseudomonas sp. UL073]|uniref:Sulfotransferase family 2 domain-containing protein n=1 Tax=Zestomonas insulae TaxID=2809017 RepID=A0ABS2IET9_9GAMM|nr:sulfotransferase family 2 domain-containing protein [Pseudomonas insulae]MBM7061183.1 sulfotransferase family 2 domain-containing protein [Pseudomonas insulae]